MPDQSSGIVHPMTNEPSLSYEPDSVRRAIGALLGVACGDSLGASVEFMSPEMVAEKHPEGLRDIVGGGPFNWQPGSPTDDTDLTVAVLQAYLAAAPISDSTQIVRIAANNFLKWFEQDPKDIGNTTRSGLFRYRETRDPFTSGVTGSHGQGNGSLMRCVPTAIARVNDATFLEREALQISAVTHASPECMWSCAAYCHLVAGLIKGSSMEEALGLAIAKTKQLAPQSVTEALERATHGNLSVDGPLPEGSGYVVDSLEIGVAALFSEQSAEEAIIAVVARGHDSDTNAAIAGGLVGARDGVQGLPERWRKTLAAHDILVNGARTLTEEFWN